MNISLHQPMPRRANSRQRALWFASAVLCSALSGFVQSAELYLHLQDPAGQPVTDVVAYIESAGNPVAREKLQAPPTDIDQINKEFVPFVTVIPVGSRIRFPNKDNIRHHVYSFSEAKKFELKLYSGTPAEPVQFDRPGVVVLGCNIHDWMLAYVLVVDSPWFGKSDASGQLRLTLPAGSHRVQLWHPALQSPTTPLTINLTEAITRLPVTVTLHADGSAVNGQ